MGDDEQLRQRLHQILAPFVLRRCKADVLLGLPPKLQYIIECPLLSDCYEKLLTERAGNNLLMQLRKACNHPRLLTRDWDQCKAASLIAESSKLQVLLQLFECCPNSAFLVFSQMTRMLNIISRVLESFNISYCYLDGSTDRHDRLHQVPNALQVRLDGRVCRGQGTDLFAFDAGRRPRPQPDPRHHGCLFRL